MKPQNCHQKNIVKYPHLLSRGKRALKQNIMSSMSCISLGHFGSGISNFQDFIFKILFLQNLNLQNFRHKAISNQQTLIA